MLPPAASCQELRWRPWPCSKCAGGLTAIGYLFRGEGADSAVRFDQPEKVVAAQSGRLVEFVNSCRHRKEVSISVPWLTRGSEHNIFLSESGENVYKRTITGVFGETYHLDQEGKIFQQKAFPDGYLVRMRFWHKLFPGAPTPLGVTALGEIVSAQPFVSGNIPTQESVDRFLEESGFKAVKKHCFLWKQSSTAFPIWLGDTRDENFVETDAGIVPIDIRVWA